MEFIMEFPGSCDTRHVCCAELIIAFICCVETTYSLSGLDIRHFWAGYAPPSTRNSWKFVGLPLAGGTDGPGQRGEECASPCQILSPLATPRTPSQRSPAHAIGQNVNFRQRKFQSVGDKPTNFQEFRVDGGHIRPKNGEYLRPEREYVVSTQHVAHAAGNMGGGCDFTTQLNCLVGPGHAEVRSDGNDPWWLRVKIATVMECINEQEKDVNTVRVRAAS
ncbi:hypothetical protein AVEN_195137-1 [Araneus ventricosus]|uniref:Uncharacterized protein n=1 Tax=Araneus ventricosus TaxID=182803 RepID=A0A4Y2BG59_ARAVE|nr:hypothetical protein AVEN_195137-1 [Araneus ventricosus]